MQNNEPSGSGAFRKFFQEKGYYIVLFLCIIAVGISGYIFIRGAISEKNSLNEETLSVATSTTVPPAAEASRPSTTTNQRPATAQTPSEPSEAVSAAADSDEAVRAAAASIRVWPVSGTSLMDYSMDQLAYNATTRDWRTHEGVDLAAVSGEQVKAACAGTVSAVYEDEYLGTTVVIAHADGYSTHYSNLAATPAVSTGDTVAAGDVIGAVGSTALLEVGEAPHLHFAVYLAGHPTDPAEYLG